MTRRPPFMDRMVAWTPVLLLGSLAALTYWLDAQVQSAGARRDASARHDTDLYIENFSAVSYDVNGHVLQSLSGKRAQHYPDDESVDITSPSLTLTDPGKPRMSVTADSGHVSGDRETVTLRGNVHALRDAPPPAAGDRNAPPAGPAALTTDMLRVVPKRSHAETDAAVTIEDPRGIIHGVGMVLDNDAHTFKIKSALRGTLQPRVLPEVISSSLSLVPSRLASAKAIALVAIALALPLVPVPAAVAATTDRDKPISFSSDTGDANLQDRGGTLVGNVLVTQGTTTIRADRIVFKQNADNSLSATAYGNPVSFRQKRDGFDEYYEGYAQRIEYDGSKDLLQLFDKALLKRGQDEIRSNYVSYNTSTEVFKAEGRPGAEPDPTGPGARVRGMFQPKSEGEETGKGKGAAKDTAGKAKDSATDAAKATAKAAPPAVDPSVTLKPAGELAPPPVK